MNRAHLKFAIEF